MLFQIPPPALPAVTPGHAYGPVQLQAIGAGAGATLKWKKVAPLPKGLKLSSTGVLSGTPNKKLNASSNSSIMVQVTETVTTVNSHDKKVKTKTIANATIPLTIT